MHRNKMLLSCGLGLTLAVVAGYAIGWYQRTNTASYRCVAGGGYWIASKEGECLEDRLRFWRTGRNGRSNFVSYNFLDGDKTSFNGFCEVEPSFVVIGGNYGPTPRKYRLTVDGEHWDLSTTQETEYRSLNIDDRSIVEKMANARQLISFEVGTWKRSFKPAPELRFFVDECRRLRTIDPDGFEKDPKSVD